MDKEPVIIYTDGACYGNPGPGGYGAILIYKSVEKEIKGFNSFTTNNKMELLAVIEALNKLKRPCNVEVYTDSRYVQRGINYKIKVRKKKYKKNIELWEQFDIVSKSHSVVCHWVRGHNGDILNERADRLANMAMKECLALKQESKLRSSYV